MFLRVLVLSLIPCWVIGQDSYRLPPKPMVDLIDAPPTPTVSVDPSRQWMLLMDRPSLPPIAELAKPELRLGGLRINPRTGGASRAPYFSKLTLQRIADQARREITGLPPNPRMGHVTWSHDGRRVAFTLTRDAAIELWLADSDTGRARRLTTARVNDTYGIPFYWVSGSQAIICRTIPESRGAAPEAAPAVPTGPVTQQSLGRKAPSRTYQDLLKNPSDEALFEHYISSQIMRVGIDGKTVSIGQPGPIGRAKPSPDGKYLLVETIHRPFSYLVPVTRFPHRVEVWDGQGRIVRQVADLPLAEEVPIAFSAAPAGPRSFDWRADAPATVYWVEAQDGGDPRRKAEVRDRLYALPVPFEGAPRPLASLALRYSGIQWGNGTLALVSESWRETRKTRTWIIQPDEPGASPKLLFDRSSEDRYRHPGAAVLRPNASGVPVLLTSNGGKTLYLIGEGASPEGNRPFLDELDVSTKQAKRLWRSEPPIFEEPVQALDERGIRWLTRRESVDDPPDYFVRDLEQEQVHQLTHFPHPAPRLAKAHKEMIHYQRADGVKLNAKLYLPPGYSREQGPLPMLMWAYPFEFKSADAASQVTDSPYRFARISSGSPLFFLTHGYAVLESPSMPIVGEGSKEPNDTYIEQLVANAKAAVDEVVRRGVADRNRIAVGGHSYGAFMTANLLAHSDLFRAGIARSGAYNRTLTPFGFQAEERTLWEAPEIYSRMSPFLFAHKIKSPILLIHGEADNNPGTFPIQSERMYQALKGHGATVRFVLLPHESHGYQARESVLHMLWEMTEWLDKYAGRER